jgi:hypothetical protein
LGASDGAGTDPDAKDGPAEPGWRAGGVLTPLEEEMVAAAETGAPVSRGDGSFTLAQMLTWGEERTIRAVVLRHLLVAGQWPADTRGVRLRGMRISGHLDLESAVLRCALSLEGCYFDADEPVCLNYATGSRIALVGCQLAGLMGRMLTAAELDLHRSTLAGPLHLAYANITGQLMCQDTQLAGRDQEGNAMVGDGMKVGAGVYLDKGFTAAGAVRLLGADIAGELNCRDAQLTGRDQYGNAMGCDGIKVSDDVVLDGKFTAAGAVRLLGADIAGQLSCRGAKLTGHDQDGDAGDAMVGDAMKVGAGVFLNEGFTAAGAVRLARADITGVLTCGGAQLNGHDEAGVAMDASGIKVGGDVFLDQKFTAAGGAVWLPGADITGQLNCGGAQLSGQDNAGNGLVGDGMKVGGDVLLNGGFTATGCVSLFSAQVGVSVLLRSAALANAGKVALVAGRMQIAGHLRWLPTQQIDGIVDLQGATVGALDDDWSNDRANGYWPVGGLLRLDGFTYGRFGGDQQATAEQRLAWIRSQYRQPATSGSAVFPTQPYEQLATVYRQAGQDDQARKVAIARRADLRKYAGLNPYRRFGNWFLDWTIKYGYQTWRAAVGLAVVFVAFLVLSVLAQHQHVMVPIGEIEGLHSVPSATRCTSDYPCFYPAGYAIDTVIPIINVHQADYWSPNGDAPWGWFWVGLSWIATAVGWALATLLVAGYTGLVRQD